MRREDGWRRRRAGAESGTGDWIRQRNGLFARFWPKKKGRNEELVLFEMALESAMRLREIYTLTWDQVDFVLRTMLRSFICIGIVFKSTTLSIFQMHVVALRVHLARKPLSILSTVPASVSVTSVDTLSAAGADVRFTSYG